MKVLRLFLGLFFSLVLVGAGAPQKSEQQVFPEQSIYHLTATWKTQDGVATKVGLKQGSLVLIGMIYSGCPHACPMTITKLQRIEKDLESRGVKSFQVILASIDVKKDTPKQLKKYMRSRSLDENRWTFLSPTKESHVRELAAVLGISYRALPGGEYAHSNIMTLLDSSGVPIAKIENLSSDHAPIVEAAVAATNKSPQADAK